MLGARPKKEKKKKKKKKKIGLEFPLRCSGISGVSAAPARRLKDPQTPVEWVKGSSVAAVASRI